jgi:hypothetical protein
VIGVLKKMRWVDLFGESRLASFEKKVNESIESDIENQVEIDNRRILWACFGVGRVCQNGR